MAKGLTRRVQILRAALVDDGLSTKPGPHKRHGAPLWASREDVTDGEKAAADTVFAEVSARFIVRASAFTRAITAKDQLVEGRQTFQIVGLKQLGRMLIEITGTTGTD